MRVLQEFAKIIKKKNSTGGLLMTFNQDFIVLVSAVFGLVVYFYRRLGHRTGFLCGIVIRFLEWENKKPVLKPICHYTQYKYQAPCLPKHFIQ